MKRLKRILIFIICVTTSVGYSQTGSFSNPGTPTTTANTDQQRNQNSQTGGFSAPTTTAPQQRELPVTTPTGPSIKQGSDDVAKGNKRAQLISQIIGGALIAVGVKQLPCCSNPGSGSCCAMAVMTIAMGGQSLVQASNHGTTAGQGMDTSSLTNGFETGLDPNSVTGQYTDGAKVGAVIPAQTLAQMEKSGVKLDPKTGKISLPNGKTINASDAGSTGAMASAGMSPSDISSLKSKVAAIEKDALAKTKLVVPTFGEEGPGGGGGQNTQTAAVDTSSYGGGGNRALASLNTKASTQGLSKTYKGEPIGIANDSIFNMMARRYQLKGRQDSFFNGTELVLQK
jgi:hypothetical protein